jgi:hypothetical protein
MSTSTPIALGEELYRMLPSLYRERDKGDFRKLLETYGSLFDQLQNLVAQKAADAFPGEDPAGDSGDLLCQPWLLSYFAQLLDVSLLSPDPEGQRDEVSNAVDWRQRKGTQMCVEDIARAILRAEVEIQEGQKRVATTPWAGDPLLSPIYYGEKPDAFQSSNPADQARHPGLPAVTPDFRLDSRAVRCDASNPAAHNRVAKPYTPWRQVHPHGVPCFPGTYQDASRRTADLRMSGIAHPRRVILYDAPPLGLCGTSNPALAWSEVQALFAKVTQLRDSGADPSAEIPGLVIPGPGRIRLSWESTDSGGSWILQGLEEEPVKVEGPISLDSPNSASFFFQSLWLKDGLDLKQGRLFMLNCAAGSIGVEGTDLVNPVLSLKSCLIEKINAPGALVRLEYVTVLQDLVAEGIQASDCILPRPRRTEVGNDLPSRGCLRYCCLPQGSVLAPPADLHIQKSTCTWVEPWFWSTDFKEPCCGVLHPETVSTILEGAEDGGELGAYHDAHHHLRRDALLAKLKEYLPVGMNALLVSDPGLNCIPPSAKNE